MTAIVIGVWRMKNIAIWLPLFGLALHAVPIGEQAGRSTASVVSLCDQASVSREERLANEMRREEDCSLAARFGRTMYRDAGGRLREHRASHLDH